MSTRLVYISKTCFFEKFEKLPPLAGNFTDVYVEFHQQLSVNLHEIGKQVHLQIRLM